MANEIEQYMFEKFKSGVEGKPSQFKSLVSLLEENIRLCSSPDKSEESSIRHYLYYLNNILTESQAPSNRFLGNWSINRKLKQIKEEISNKNKEEISRKAKQESGHPGAPEEAIPKQGSTQNGTLRSVNSTGSSSGKPKSSGSSSPAVEGKVHGLKEEVENLEKSLNPDVRFQAIGIVGIGGIGKTTLCREFFNSDKVKADFAPRIWVSVSGPPVEGGDIRDAILKRALQQLGVEEEDIDSEFSTHKLAGLTSLLHQHLWGKKYFIVFDDVRYGDIGGNKNWYQELETYLNHGKNWDEKLAYALPKGHGGTVLVTGRSEEVVKKMVGPANLQRKLPLQRHEDCWEIFKEAAHPHGKTLEEQSNPEHKMEIMRQCKHVPSAAKLMGQIVKQILEEPPQSQMQKEPPQSQMQNGSANP